jgi:hypothetical protein
MKFTTREGLLPLFATLVLSAAPCSLQAQTNITFDGIPAGTNISGSTIQGVTFNMSNGSLIVGAGPGCQTLVCDPSAVGATVGQSLSMHFANPTSSLMFGVALNVTSGTPDFFVQLLDASNALIGNYTVGTALDGHTYVEGLFSYGGGADVAVANVSFQQGTYGAFAIDNITTAPEPASLVLLGSGLIGLLGISRHRRSNLS